MCDGRRTGLHPGVACGGLVDVGRVDDEEDLVLLLVQF
jgi:hypothetical protein